MNGSRIVNLALFGMVVLPGVQGALANGLYSFTAIDFPGASSTVPFSINNNGQIVGHFRVGGSDHGFLYSGSNFTTIDAPAATTQTQAFGINDGGQIVGAFIGSDGEHGFLDTGGAFTLIDVPGVSGDTSAVRINSSGQIVGQFSAGSGISGFLYSNGSYIPIDFPNAPNNGFGTITQTFGINDSGQIVGTVGGLGERGFLYSGGNFTTLDFPGTISMTDAYGINNSGQIVGYAFDPELHSTRAFLDTDGNFITLDFPGADPTFGFGINDSGQIVGSYVDSAGRERGFLATPAVVPEPCIAPVLAGCLIGLFAIAHRPREAWIRRCSIVLAPALFAQSEPRNPHSPRGSKPITGRFRVGKFRNNLDVPEISSPRVPK